MAAPNDRPGWEAEMDEQMVIADQLLKDNPAIGSHMTAVILAGDILSKRRWRAQMDAGKVSPEQVINIIGSYERLNLAVELVAEGRVTKEYVFGILPNLWSMSDPDDTDPRFLALWREAWEANGYVALIDGDDDTDLPDVEVLDIYRGQDPGDTLGIAWSLDQKIAEKFAKGAALRQANRNGDILHARIERRLVMGYLTRRGEAEVVIDPADIL